MEGVEVRQKKKLGIAVGGDTQPFELSRHRWGFRSRGLGFDGELFTVGGSFGLIQ